MISDAVFFTDVRPETNVALSTSTTQLQEIIVTALDLTPSVHNKPGVHENDTESGSTGSALQSLKHYHPETADSHRASRKATRLFLTKK